MIQPRTGIVILISFLAIRRKKSYYIEGLEGLLVPFGDFFFLEIVHIGVYYGSFGKLRLYQALSACFHA